MPGGAGRQGCHRPGTSTPGGWRTRRSTPGDRLVRQSPEAEDPRDASLQIGQRPGQVRSARSNALRRDLALRCVAPRGHVVHDAALVVLLDHPPNHLAVLRDEDPPAGHVLVGRCVTDHEHRVRLLRLALGVDGPELHRPGCRGLRSKARSVRWDAALLRSQVQLAPLALRAEFGDLAQLHGSLREYAAGVEGETQNGASSRFCCFCFCCLGPFLYSLGRRRTSEL
jgi:hypothetical protein